jgi:TP901 family phage tail tape measure protein
MSDINMRILLSASQGNVMSVVSNVTSALTGSSGLGGALLGVGVAAGAVAIGLGITAVKASGDFQQAMLLNVAHAGLAQSQMNGVSQSILAMAPALGQMPTALAQALYPVLSSFSGISDSSAKAKISLVELQDAGESVAGTTTSVTSVTNAASAAFNAFGMTSTDTNTNISRMNSLFDIMNNTVSAGNMQWSNYSTVIGKLSVGAHGAGVSFVEENAALADLTNQGYSAQLGGTYLNNMFTTMYTKADTVAKNAQKLGESFDETKYKTLDLAGRIQYLNTATDGNQASLLKVLNGNSTALKTFDALSNSMGGYKSNLDSLNHSQGATATAFQTASSGFNFGMQKMQVAGQVLLITIGSQLLPTITQLVTNVTPIISSFATWLVNSHALENGVHTLVATISNMVATGTAIVGFFQHNQTAMVALQAVMITIAGFILGVVVEAFVAWAIAMVPVVVEALTLAAPFILAGIVVAAVVFGIIMAIEHWGAIVSWLSGVWSAFSGWFMGLLHTIGDFFKAIWGDVVSWWQGLWTGTTSWIQGALQNIASFFIGIWAGIVHGVQAAWAFIVLAAKIALIALVIIIFAPIIAIAALFIWLYQHNTYFKMFCDMIVAFIRGAIAWIVTAWQVASAWLAGLWATIVTAATTAWNAVSGAITTAVQVVWNWLVAAWNTVTGWLTVAWNAVSGVATAAWNAVTGAIQAAVNVVWGWLTGIWNTASGWLSSKWNAFADLAKTAWGLVSGVFSSIWNTYISKPMSDAWNSVSKALSDWGPRAMDAGKNFIQMLVNGITSGAGAIWNAVSGIANNIWKALGFHSPAKEGPGADADRWMPNLVSMLSAGLIAGVPKMQLAVNAVAQPLTALSHGPSPTSASPLSSGQSGGSSITTIINVTVNGFVGTKRDVVDWIEKDLDSRLRRSGVLSTSTSGGKAGF